MNLAQTQEFFWNAIANVEPVTRGDVEAIFVGTPEHTALARLEIYAGMYINRLMDALGAEFPRVKAKLGDAKFFELAESYVRAFPSTHPSIDHVGRHFPKYLRKHTSRSLAALATLERAESVVFDAADTPPVDAQALAAVSPEQLPHIVFTPIAALACVGTTVVFRGDETVRTHTMSRLEARAFKLMLRRRPLGEICEVFAGEAEPIQSAFAAIGGWLSSGWVARIA
jgi:hypothetical protein